MCKMKADSRLQKINKKMSNNKNRELQERPLNEPSPRSNATRPNTPKGSVFNNLDETHQAITSKLAQLRPLAHEVPPAPFSSPVGSSVTLANPVDQAVITSGNQINPDDSVPRAEHLEFVDLLRPTHQRPLTALYVPAGPLAPEDNNTPAYSAPATPGSSHVGKDNVGEDTGHTPVNRAARDTESTIEDIYNQYLPSTSTELSSTQGSHNTTPSNGATSRIPELIHKSITRRQRFSPPGDPPQVSLPELPETLRDAQHYARGSSTDHLRYSPAAQATDSVLNSQLLFGTTSRRCHEGRATAPRANSSADSKRNDNLEPGESVTSHVERTFIDYIGPSSRRGRKWCEDEVHQEQYSTHTGLLDSEFSTGGLTTNSEEDPFKYDRGSYGIFLQPAREREVSAALRRFSGVSTEADTGSCPASEEQDQVPPVPVPSTKAPHSDDNVARSSNPFLSNLYYYRSAQGPERARQNDPNWVSVPDRGSVMPDPVVANRDQAALISEARHGTENIEAVTSDGGDWETVGTSVGQFDSNRPLASDTDLIRPHLVKITSSSIADYSDVNSTPPAPSDAFSSTDRILLHPSPSRDGSPRYRRVLRDTGRPIFLPKPRIHRVNGYLQNSSRLFTDPTASSTSRFSTRHYLIEKLSASIRSRTAKKRAQNLHHLDSPHRWSKFGSHESFGWFDKDREDARVCHGDRNDEHPTPHTSGNERNREGGAEASQSVLSTTPTDELLTEDQERGDVSARANTPLGSPTLFSFPLISLEESTRRTASRIENGEDDLTVTSGTRTRNHSSVVSSRTTQRTTPLTPHVTPPIPAYCCRSTRMRNPCPAKPHPGYSSSMRDISPFTSPRSPPPAPPGSRFYRVSMRSSPSFPALSTGLDTPRLFRGRLRDGGRRTTITPDLHGIASSGLIDPWGHLTDDGYLSWEARRRRKAFYHVMCILCILPFLAPLVYRGTFDSALAWYTQGETDQLSRQQRRGVLNLGCVVSALWLCVLAVVVTLAVNGKLA